MNGIRLSLAPASPLRASKDSALPTRVKLLGWGRNETANGVVLVDDLTSKVFSANQKAIGRERVQVDFEHNTVPGTTEFNRTNEPRPVAGHSTLVCVPGEGIFAESVTYTATGEKSGPDYEDVSLAPYLDKDGRVIAAHSWTLTHTGAAYGASFASAPETLSADLKILSSTSTPQIQMIKLAFLAACLGLPETADEASVSTELKKRLAPQAVDLAPLSARIATLETKAPGGTDLTPVLTRLTAVENKLNSTEAGQLEVKRGELVTLFSSQGKVPLKKDGKAYTADELKALPVDTLELLLANTAVTVPLSARNAAHTTEQKKGYRVKVGDKEIVDMSAIFNDEAQQRGLTSTPPAL